MAAMATSGAGSKSCAISSRRALPRHKHESVTGDDVEIADGPSLVVPGVETAVVAVTAADDVAAAVIG